MEDAKASAEGYKKTLEALLESAQTALAISEEVASRHAEEVKATKHLAHVKDLGRIAAIREVML